MVSTQFSHFPGPLKQKNKLHKSGSHKSKRQLCKENKNETNSRKNSSCMFKSKLERANEKKRNIIENKKQIKQHLKEVGFGISPMPIALISLSSDFPIENIIDSYYSDEKYKVERDWCTTNCRDFYRVESLDKRQKFLFLVVTQDSAFYMHDVIQSSQAVWILSTDFSASNSDFTPVFDTFESVLLPPIYHLIKFQKNDQKSISTFLHQYCQQFGPFKPEKDKILEIKANVVVTPAKLIKCVPNFYLRSNYFARQPEKQRANIHVISEALNYDHHNGILEIGGTIRGGKLSANDSVAIPGFGNFKISQIASKSSIDVRSNAAPTILSVRSVEFDLPQNIDAMSECDNNEGFDDILLREDHQLFEPPQFVPMEYDNTHESNADSEYETADSDCFSDVETPSIDNLSTNQKLAYFCSINDCTIYTSLCENPSNRKIIQLNNYVAIKNYAMQYACPAEVESGKSVKVSISDVPYHVFEYFSKIIGRLTIHKIYPYEDQLSIVHYFIHKKDYTPDVHSTEKYVIFCGPRRFRASCIFSGPSNKKTRCHKIIPVVTGEAYLIVTVVAFITFPQAPVTLFSQNHDGELTFIGSGHVLQPAHRLLIHELVLTGTVRKVNKKSVVVSGIFDSRNEVLHFKAVNLYTDSGDKGHIIKPIGTHGAMKCHFTLASFNRQKVCARLYKPQHPVCDIETDLYCL